MSICTAKEKYPVFMMGFIPSSLRNTWLKIKRHVSKTLLLSTYNIIYFVDIKSKDNKMDERLKWLELRISSSLRPRNEELKNMFLNDENR